MSRKRSCASINPMMEIDSKCKVGKFTFSLKLYICIFHHKKILSLIVMYYFLVSNINDSNILSFSSLEKSLKFYEIDVCTKCVYSDSFVMTLLLWSSKGFKKCIAILMQEHYFFCIPSIIIML